MADPWASARDELLDLLPAVSARTATPAEVARVRALIPACLATPEGAAELRAQLATLRLAESALFETVAPQTPPPQIKAALMQQIARGTVSAPAHTTPLGRHARWGRTLLAVAAALLIVSNGAWLAAYLQTQTRLTAAEAQTAALRNSQRNALTLMSNLNMQRVGINASDDGLIRLATLYFNPATGQAALVSDGLAPVGEALTYQLWLIEGGQPHSLGVFRPDSASGIGWLAFSLAEAAAADAVVGISLEPAGGSSQPTTAPVAVGPLPT